MSDAPPEPVVPKPASTVVPLRESEAGFEVLLVQRAKRDGSRGIWVFPGGQLEAPELERAESDVVDAARRAASRETHEEAGILLDPRHFGLIARWITPPISPRRFDTWFFAAEVASNVEVVVDQVEIVDHRWIDAGGALEAQRAGEIGLAPPTYVTLSWLEEFGQLSDAMRGLARQEVVTIEPVICPVEGGACMLYPGDEGYHDADLEREGGRDRLWRIGKSMRYERVRRA